MRYIISRIFKLIPTLIGVTLITFSLIFLSPSDPAEMYFHNQGVPYTTKMVEEYREAKGLNDNFMVQYGTWGKKFMSGDFGESYSDGRAVKDKISQALPYTVCLAINSLIFTLIISIPLGFYMGYKPKGILVKILSTISLLFVSVPNFIVALGLIYLLSAKLRLLPVLSADPSIGIIMPTMTLVIAMSAKYIRQIKVITEKELKNDYINGLRTRGVSEVKIIVSTVLKNTSIEIITLVGVSIGSLMGGVAIVENIFNWPGIGNLIVESVLNRDIPMIQGIVVWLTVAYVFINLITDISYSLLDPRIHIGGEDNYEG